MRGEDRGHASLPRSRNDPGRLPGGWQAAVIAALAALLAGYLGRPGAGTPRAEGGSDVSRVAAVAPGEFRAALGTLDVTPGQLARLTGGDSCSRRLAWVTVVRAPGQPSGRIRLRSGGYVSPAFELTEAPVRVAIPYPAPYPTGRGMISVLGASTGAIVALVPSWHVAGQDGTENREVTWSPVAGCPGAGT